MTNRRDFLKTAAVGAAAVSTLSIARSAHAAGSDILRLGLVGCGGRGNGALANAMEADENTVVTAFGDLFRVRSIDTRTIPAARRLRTPFSPVSITTKALLKTATLFFWQPLRITARFISPPRLKLANTSSLKSPTA